MDLGFKLDPGEQVIRIIRRHPIDLLPTVAMSIVLVLVSIGLAYVSSRFAPIVPVPTYLIIILTIVLLVLSALILLIGLYVYHRNFLVFTNLHYVQVEQIGIFGHRVSQLSFLRVEDVTGRKVGLLGTIFNFGEVTVQSAAQQEEFIFYNAPNPEGIADEALQTHERCMDEAMARGHNPHL